MPRPREIVSKSVRLLGRCRFASPCRITKLDRAGTQRRTKRMIPLATTVKTPITSPSTPAKTSPRCQVSVWKIANVTTPPAMAT